MTFGVIEEEEPLLSELIALAFELAGHDCLVLENIDQATRILQAIRIDSMVMDLHMTSGSVLDWLETVAATQPDLPSQTVLLTRCALTTDEEARVKMLAADVVAKPLSLLGVESIVTGLLLKARLEQTGRSARGRAPRRHAVMTPSGGR